MYALSVKLGAIIHIGSSNTSFVPSMHIMLEMIFPRQFAVSSGPQFRFRHISYLFTLNWRSYYRVLNDSGLQWSMIFVQELLEVLNIPILRFISVVIMWFLSVRTYWSVWNVSKIQVMSFSRMFVI